MQPKALNRVFNPHMLVLARQSRGMTQGQLAKAVKATQGWISKLENGLAPEPADDRVESLSSALRYPVAFFYRRESMTGLPASFTRKYSRLPARVFEKLSALTNIWRINIAVLLRAAELDTIHEIPNLDIDSYRGDPEEVARAVRAAWQLPPGPIHNLIAVLEDAGVILVPCDFGVPDLDAIAQPVPGTHPLVFFSTSAPTDRLRFTLAHELGHLVMHRVPTLEMEPQAHGFAAEFLMPRRDIETYFSGGVSIASLATLKPIWRVSMGALLRRAFDLGSITESRYRRLNAELSRRGYRRQEPPELAIAREDPTVLRELFEMHTERLGYTREELLQLFTVDADDFATTYGIDQPKIRLMVS